MFQLLLVPLFIAFLGYIETSSLLWLSIQKKSLPNPNAIMDFNATTNRYTFNKLHENIFIIDHVQNSKEQLNKETVQKAMTRICNAIYQKGLINQCSDADKVATVWSFATDIADEGSLLTVWNGTATNAFSCGDEARYGRYLIHNTLTLNLVTKYSYNLKGISDTDNNNTGARTYPCGYSEIVYID